MTSIHGRRRLCWLSAFLGFCLVASACGTRVAGSQAGTALQAGQSGSGTVDTNGGGAPAVTGSDLGASAAGGAAGPSSQGVASGGAAASAAGGAAGPSSQGATSGGSGGSAAGGTTGPSSQGVTSNTITIGMTAPMSGVVGFLGAEAAGAVDSYFQMINAQGGVNGRKLKLIVYDDQFNSTQMAANIRRLYTQDHVFALFGSFSDSYNSFVTGYKVPTYVFGVTPTSFESKYPTVYPIVGNALAWTLDLIGALKQKNVFKPGMRVAILYDNQQIDVAPYLTYFKKAWTAAGADVVSTDAFSLSSGDCSSLVLKMRSLNIDYWDFDSLGWTLCVSAAQRLGYHPNIGWGSWATSVADLSSQAGPYVNGVWGGSEANQPDNQPGGNGTTPAAMAQYVDAIKTYHPNLNDEGDLESPATTGYWAGAAMLVAAIKAQGQTVTTAGVNNWMNHLSDFPVGIMPPIQSMSPNCKQGQPAVWLAQWQWNSQTSSATRTPATSWVYPADTSAFAPGPCWLTSVSNLAGG